MRAKQSLYDLLQVSQSASQDAIDAAFERLTRKYGEGSLPTHGDMSQETAYNLIKDAFSTLSNPDRRETYDRRLMGSATPTDIRVDLELINGPLLSTRTKVFAALVLLGLGWYIYTSQRDAMLARNMAQEAQRMMIQKARQLDRELEARADAESANARAIYDEQKQEREQRAEQERAIAERERAIREADNASRRLQSAEESRRREDERKSRDLQNQANEQQRQQEYRRQEEARRAEAERQRLVEAARRTTPERPKGAVIPPANPF